MLAFRVLYCLGLTVLPFKRMEMHPKGKRPGLWDLADAFALLSRASRLLVAMKDQEGVVSQDAGLDF